MQDKNERETGKSIQAVERAAEILKLFSASVSAVSAVDVAEQLGLNRTTAYRYCVSLELAGFLERRTESGAFTPGRLLLQIGALALGRREIVQLAPAAMRELSQKTGLTVVLSLWGSVGPVIAHVEEDTHRSVVVTVRVGTQLPLTSAQAKIFLAFQADQLLTERLINNLPVNDKENLRNELGTIREKGIALLSERGAINAAAAPIFDGKGITAAIALVGPSDELQVYQAQSSALNHLAKTAKELTIALNGSL